MNRRHRLTRKQAQSTAVELRQHASPIFRPDRLPNDRVEHRPIVILQCIHQAAVQELKVKRNHRTGRSENGHIPTLLRAALSFATGSLGLLSISVRAEDVFGWSILQREVDERYKERESIARTAGKR